MNTVCRVLSSSKINCDINNSHVIATTTKIGVSLNRNIIGTYNFGIREFISSI